MPNQTSSTLAIPPKWQPRYLLKRIGEEDIEIPLATRDAIVKALAAGLKYVQVGEYTIMLNAIKSIDPLWPPQNIPPRPKATADVEVKYGKAFTSISNQAELDLWDRLFGEKSRDQSIEEWVSR